MKTKSKTKKRNPQDATRRNVQAANKRFQVMEQFINDLSFRIMKLEIFIDDIGASLHRLCNARRK